MPGIHDSAEQGYALGAATYQQGRPDYPAAIVDWLRSSLGLIAGRTVCDLGAGTGKFLPFLAATGADIIAVEPVREMREKLQAAHPGAVALEGSAEAIPLGDASVDAVICAQAFHWFANATALGEIHRVLRPGGRLGLVWNVRDESLDWVAALSKIIDRHQGDAPRFVSGAWRRPFGTTTMFSPLREQRFAYRHVGPPHRVIVDRSLSVSFIAALPPSERSRVERQVGALIASTPALAGKDEVAFPYVTMAYSGVRLG
ncbi:methyltransferase family protein [Panacagrimonas perspica]|uniref:Methyltransferase family protein n=1 Tax=Panacagrimonas perspica TaxID=381431 RepID=A0A4R7PEI2_9GAMM|nr:class I SAM-dependent methyltransferase [Panacagrimonas perspica]TDU32623.1 methyltransferase family protein [Panacagrimonas perspica]THD05511.1 SAM-dependent methyltransferase [Panacagrimonas perspica]